MDKTKALYLARELHCAVLDHPDAAATRELAKRLLRELEALAQPRPNIPDWFRRLTRAMDRAEDAFCQPHDATRSAAAAFLDTGEDEATPEQRRKARETALFDAALWAGRGGKLFTVDPRRWATQPGYMHHATVPVANGATERCRFALSATATVPAPRFWDGGKFPEGVEDLGPVLSANA